LGYHSQYSYLAMGWMVKGSISSKGEIYLIFHSSCSVGSRFKAVGPWGWPAHLHVVLRLRMGGCIPHLPLCTLVACTGTLPF